MLTCVSPYLNIREMFVHDRIIIGNQLHTFKKVTLFFCVKVFTMATKIKILLG